MVVLSASGQVVEDAVVAVSVGVLWHVVTVVPPVELVFISLLRAVAVLSDVVVLVVIHVLSSSPKSSATSLIITSRISISASDAIRTCFFAPLFAVALCETHRLLPSAPMPLAGPIRWPCG